MQCSKFHHKIELENANVSLTILNWTESGRKQSGRYLTPQLTAAKWEPWSGTSQIPQRSPMVSVKTPVLQVWEHSALFYPTCLNQRQIQRQISCSHLRSVIPSLCFPLDLISTQRRNNMKSRLRQCTDWFHQYVQSSWAGTDRNVTYSPPQMETSFSLFFLPNSFWLLRINCSLQKDSSPETFSTNRTKVTFLHQNESTYQALF